MLVSLVQRAAQRRAARLVIVQRLYVHERVCGVCACARVPTLVEVCVSGVVGMWSSG